MGEGDLPGARARYEEAVGCASSRRRRILGRISRKSRSPAATNGSQSSPAVKADIATSLAYTADACGVSRPTAGASGAGQRVAGVRPGGFRRRHRVSGSARIPPTTSQVRRGRAADVSAILDQLAVTRERWTREKHAGALPPSNDDLARARERRPRASRARATLSDATRQRRFAL